MTHLPIISNTFEGVMDTFEGQGNVLFEEEYTTILNKFIERKIRFFPMF